MLKETFSFLGNFISLFFLILIPFDNYHHYWLRVETQPLDAIFFKKNKLLFTFTLTLTFDPYLFNLLKKNIKYLNFLTFVIFMNLFNIHII